MMPTFLFVNGIQVGRSNVHELLSFEFLRHPGQQGKVWISQI